jgi:hypothetical protein
MLSSLRGGLRFMLAANLVDIRIEQDFASQATTMPALGF